MKQLINMKLQLQEIDEWSSKAKKLRFISRMTTISAAVNLVLVFLRYIDFFSFIGVQAPVISKYPILIVVWAISVALIELIIAMGYRKILSIDSYQDKYSHIN